MRTNMQSSILVAFLIMSSSFVFASKVLSRKSHGDENSKFLNFKSGETPVSSNTQTVTGISEINCEDFKIKLAIIEGNIRLAARDLRNSFTRGEKREISNKRYDFKEITNKGQEEARNLSQEFINATNGKCGSVVNEENQKFSQIVEEVRGSVRRFL